MRSYTRVSIFFFVSPLLVSATIESPSTCHSEDIEPCLARFQAKYDSCDKNDYRCQCQTVITTGANCYVSCPQEDMTNFIKTYSNGKCASYDPYLSFRDSAVQINNENEDVDLNSATIRDKSASSTIKFPSKVQNTPVAIDKTKTTTQKASNISTTYAASTAQVDSKTTFVQPKSPIGKPSESTTPSSNDSRKGQYSGQMKALTITPSDPTTTYSVTQGYNSHLEQSRIRNNLKSIRMEKAKGSSPADRLKKSKKKSKGVQRREAGNITSSSSNGLKAPFTAERMSIVSLVLVVSSLCFCILS